MTNILLFLVPSALLTMLPFLASCVFDSQQPHGLISFDALCLLLCFAPMRQKTPLRFILLMLPMLYALCGPDDYSTVNGLIVAVLMLLSICIPVKKRIVVLYCFALFLFLFVLDASNFFYSTFSLALKDVWQIASFYWWGISLFICIPLFVSLGLTIDCVMLFEKGVFERVSYKRSGLTIAVIIVVTILQSCFFCSTPLFEFSMFKFVERSLTPGQVSQSSILMKDAKETFESWQEDIDSLLNTEKRTTVEILVESWGVSKNVFLTKKLLDIFDENERIHFKGLLARTQGHTQGAEWEDFRTPEGKINGATRPLEFKNVGCETWYIHGYDGKFYERIQNYGNLGFDNILFREDFAQKGLNECKYGFEGICDSSVVEWLDDLLSEKNLKYVYWTTLDAHPPYEGQVLSEDDKALCYSQSITGIECVYYTRQRRTLSNIKVLAKKHPEVRFVIKGDHRPMGSLAESDFVASFYYKWVSLVILSN